MVNKKLAIVCGSPSSEMLAPFYDKSFEIWVLGNRCSRYDRYDRIFEIHDNLEQHCKSYPQSLVDRNRPLVVGECFPLYSPNVEIYPYEEVNALIGYEYLTSSSAAMLAYALISGYKNIYLYGVDMAVDDHEYFWQRPCMEFWVGFARGFGVTVNIHQKSPICKSEYCEGKDYGFTRPHTPAPRNEYASMAHQHRVKIEHKYQRLKELMSVESEINELKKAITAHDGAAQVYERLAKVRRAEDAGNKLGDLQESAVIA